ncbi:MAG TPA: heparinase II/III family protein [Methylomirabilota bacterium]|nr:heparinase II/III family protein [Methylomirabilota bacterium]
MSVIADTGTRPMRRPREPLAPALQARLRLPTGLLWERAWYDLRKPLFGSRVYGLLLPARIPIGPSPMPVADAWPGNAIQGAAIAQGVFAFAGQTIRDPAPLWAPVGARAAWLEQMQAFEWLRDLRAAGGDASRRVGRELVGRWIDGYWSWNALAWRPDLIGRRLAAWLAHYEFLGIAGDPVFRERFLLSVARQANHLSRVLPGGLSGHLLLAAIVGMMHAGLAVPRGEVLLARGRRLLEREIRRQILPDGGHRERSPGVQLAVLRLFTGLRGALSASGQPVPAALDEAIAGVAQLLRLFQHGDGGLALFNDSNEEEDWLVDMALARANPSHAGSKGLVLKEAPESGFQRLVANRTLVIVDAGQPAPPGVDHHAHAGTLAFEMSVGRERLIVNCGAHAGHADWWAAQRSTAAHSTLVIAESNSSILAPEGGLVRGPRLVTCRREEAEGSSWLDMSHDGYAANLDLIHRRRLFLAANGEDLRGEDRLTGRGRKPFAIRFHLHPSVSASMAQNGQAALLRLPSGAGWRLRATGAPVSLEESVYLGRRGESRKTLQVVVSGDKGDEDAVVKWAIAREGKPGRGR